MRFTFRQWKPDPNVHNVYDKDVQGFRGEDFDTFLRYWNLWCRQFPTDWKMVTMAIDSRGLGLERHCGIQLRFWFGEPYSIREGYVDSMGHNLIVHIFERDPDKAFLYRLFVEHLIGDRNYQKEMINRVDVWRLK